MKRLVIKGSLVLTMFILYVNICYGSFENTVIKISSDTVKTIAWEYNNRDVYIQNPDVNIYIRYRVDGSTVNIASGGESGEGDGFYLPTWQGQSIQSKDDINLQLEPGESEIYVNVLIDRY